MAKLNQLTRYSRIINKLSGLRHYVPAGELIDAMGGLSDFGINYTLRTLQRDIRSIEQVFGIEIRNKKGDGYYIASVPDKTEMFAGLLSDYQILTSLEESRGLHEYIIPDHRTPVISIPVNDLVTAIRDRRIVRFSYYLPLCNEVRHYDGQPYFIKQSQGKWYLLAIVKDNIRSFELGRFRSFNVLEQTFERNEDFFPKDQFSNSFGIWDDENLPIEHIVLSVSQQEWRFMKTYPIHHTQELIEETPDRVTLSIDVRITHDLMMDLLSRAHSLRIIEPASLREDYRRILLTAANNNM